MRRPTAPPPRELVVKLRALAALLDAPSDVGNRTQGERALELAAVLAARGWPSSTLNNGSRSTNELTSVESAAANPNPMWDGVDDRLKELLHRLWEDGLEARSLVTSIVSHAGPDERKTSTQAGSGDCMACGRFCSGADLDRLRGGYCNGCRMAWERAGRPDRVAFQRARPQQLEKEQTA